MDSAADEREPGSDPGQAAQAPATKESTEELIARRGLPVISSDGQRIGVIEEIFEDATTGTPEWIGLGAGVLFAHRVLVPLRDATTDQDGTLIVHHTKDAVTGSPEVELLDDDFLAQASEAELNAYYGLAPTAAVTDGSPRLHLRRYTEDQEGDTAAGSAGSSPS
jgi:hypothetical protein